MADGAARPVPVWFWVVGVLAAAWEAIGCYFYLVQVRMTPTDMAALPPPQADAFAAMPAWQWSAFAVAVWIGLVGALALLARSRWAVPAFTISLVAAVIQYGYSFLATPILQRMSPAEALPLPVSIILVGAFLVWFSARARRRGWLR